MTNWWELKFDELQAEIRKAFKRNIPDKQLSDWQSWFENQCAEHIKLTQEIIGFEVELNQRVYALYSLTPTEIQLIEDSTKYKYGEI